MKNFFYLLLLLGLFIISALYLNHIYGEPFMDCGREAALPLLMLKGKILFKDIFGMYNPLSYQINALAYLVFGASVNTLYGLAYVNAFIILVGIYFICRRFMNEFYSFSLTFLIMSFYIFGCTTICSYLFPYSFAFPYATSCFIYSVLFFLIYIEKSDNKWLYLSSALLGFSFANKPEFAVCILPMIVFLAIKKKDIKQFLYTFFFFLLPVIFSYGLLFLQGFRWNDFLNYLDFSHRFFNTDEQIYYTFNVLMSEWSKYTFKKVFYNFVDFSILTVVSVLYLNLFKKGFYYKLFGLVLIPFYCNFCMLYITKIQYMNVFCWIFVPLILILYFKTKKISNFKDEMLLFLVCTGFLSMWRVNFIPYTQYSCSIYMLLPIAAVWIYFIENDLEYFKKFDYKLYVSIFFIIISVLNIYRVKLESEKLFKIDIKNSIMYTVPEYAYLYQELKNWIENNTKPSESVLVMPEGIMLNFATDRETKPMYYHLIPNHISTLKEENIVKGLEKDRPDYIIITNVKYGMYGRTRMCKDFGIQICNFTEENYDLKNDIKYESVNDAEIEYSVPLSAKIYKLKNKD